VRLNRDRKYALSCKPAQVKRIRTAAMCRRLQSKTSDGSLKKINKLWIKLTPQEADFEERAKRNDPAPAPIYEA